MPIPTLNKLLTSKQFTDGLDKLINEEKEYSGQYSRAFNGYISIAEQDWGTQWEIWYEGMTQAKGFAQACRLQFNSGTLVSDDDDIDICLRFFYQSCLKPIMLDVYSSLFTDTEGLRPKLTEYNSVFSNNNDKSLILFNSFLFTVTSSFFNLFLLVGEREEQHQNWLYFYSLMMEQTIKALSLTVDHLSSKKALEEQLDTLHACVYSKKEQCVDNSLALKGGHSANQKNLFWPIVCLALGIIGVITCAVLTWGFGLIPIGVGVAGSISGASVSFFGGYKIYKSSDRTGEAHTAQSQRSP